jgi:hypothetical protein
MRNQQLLPLSCQPTKQLALALQPKHQLEVLDKPTHDGAVAALARLLLEAVALAEVDDDAP